MCVGGFFGTFTGVPVLLTADSQTKPAAFSSMPSAII